MKKTFFSFLKDELGAILTYLLSTAVIILFYTLELEHQVEFGYPLMLSLFIGAVFEGINFYRYVKRNHKVSKMMQGTISEDCFLTEFERYLAIELKQLHRTYHEMLDEITLRQRNNQRFASALIHNMKTPVAVSNLILQRARLHEIQELEALVMLREENDKLITALDNILELQRFEESVKDYQPQSLSLEQEVKDLINANRSLFIQNHVYPKLLCEDTSCIVLADAKWNRVMLQQLISNAVKYSSVHKTKGLEEEMEPKYITFEIKKQINNNIPEVELRIQDEGIGIPSYDLPRVFEPFYTGDNGRKCYNSSGIGLYLCKEISLLLKTQLKIESKVNLGTTVVIGYLTKL